MERSKNRDTKFIIMNNAEIYILTNDLTLYKELESLNLLELVTEIMQNFIEGEKESYELGIEQQQGEIENLEIMNNHLESEIMKKDSEIAFLKLGK